MRSSELPDVVISAEDKISICEYLFSELTQCANDRQSLVELWKSIQTLYEQTSVPEKANFPFEGAAHIMVPVIPSYVEQIHARIMNTLYGTSDHFSVEPDIGEFDKYAKACRNWINWAADNELDLEQGDYSLLMELLKLGNMAAKVHYVYETKTVNKWDDVQKKYTQVTEVMRDQPEILHLSINDFWFPAYVRSLKEADWKSHRFFIGWNVMKERAVNGRYNEEAVKAIKNWYVTSRDDYSVTTQSLANLQDPGAFFEFELHEVWFRYPLKHISTDGGIDGGLPIDQQSLINSFAPAVDLVAVFHKESRTLLRIQYNWYPLGMDPFEHEPYVGREHQVLGIGIGQMALPFQIEISTMHNQRLDNATLANTVGYKYKADSSIPANLKITPGGGVPVDNMDDFDSFSLGQKYDSTIAEEKNTLGLLQERIGAKELDLDQANLSRTPATTTLALLQEKGRRLDNVIRNVRRFKKRCILKAILLYQEYYDVSRLTTILGDDGALVAEFLTNTSPQKIWDGIGVSVTATTSTTSKELDRQSKLSLVQLLTQYYGQIAQYSQAAMQAPPQLQPVFLHIISGLSQMVTDILDDFNIKNKGEFTLGIEKTEGAALQAGAPAVSVPVQNGGVPTIPPALAAQIAQANAGGQAG